MLVNEPVIYAAISDILSATLATKGEKDGSEPKTKMSFASKVEILHYGKQHLRE